MEIDLELDRMIQKINEEKAKRVCIQLPDGLKPKAKEIHDKIKSETNNEVDVLIWCDTCFGACDTPLGIDDMGVDILFQWGHSIFRK